MQRSPSIRQGFVRLGVAMAASTVLGCQSGGSKASTDGAEAGDAETGGGQAVPTYAEDVAPILAEHCVVCHQVEGGGPFPLTSYEEAKTEGPAMRVVTHARIMPPYLADASGACGEFRDARWLNDEEIATIGAWVEGGMPEGDARLVPEPPPPLPHLDQAATHSVAMAMEYAPDRSLDDDYRCFLVDLGLDQDLFMTDFEVVAGNKPIVHHVIIYQPTSATEASKAVQLDSDEPGYGYTCFGSAIVDSTLVAAWAPGSTVVTMPENTGVVITQGIPLVLQVHYNNQGGEGNDLTRVDLKLAERVEKRLIPFFVADPDKLVLEPGQDEVTSVASIRLADLGVTLDSFTLLGMGPHMHKRGTSMTMALQRGGETAQECLINVPRWDFNWQLAYWLKNPVRIQDTDTMLMSCTYDTSRDDGEVRWGEGTGDEMCLMLMLATVP